MGWNGQLGSQISTPFLASQPPLTYHPRNKALLQGLLTNGFPLLRTAIKPLFLTGGYVARGVPGWRSPLLAPLRSIVMWSHWLSPVRCVSWESRFFEVLGWWEKNMGLLHMTCAPATWVSCVLWITRGSWCEFWDNVAGLCVSRWAFMSSLDDNCSY